MAWPGPWRQAIEGYGGTSSILFVGVILGVVDAAMAYMDRQLRARGAPDPPLPALEKVEWVMLSGRLGWHNRPMTAPCARWSGTAGRGATRR